MPGRKPLTKFDEPQLFEYAVRSLSARAATSDELRTKLRRRAASFPDIDTVIARLKDIGYLDDKRFAEMYTNLRVENDGFGRMRVLHDLRTRRVPPKLAERAVVTAFENKNELEMVAAYVERRMAVAVARGDLSDDKKLAAAYRKLRRAGFASGPILTVLKRYAKNPELLDETPAEDEDANA